MKLIQLEYFCAVSRYHSITQAAQKLYVTQPAIPVPSGNWKKNFPSIFLPALKIT